MQLLLRIVIVFLPGPAGCHFIVIVTTFYCVFIFQVADFFYQLLSKVELVWEELALYLLYLPDKVHHVQYLIVETLLIGLEDCLDSGRR